MIVAEIEMLTISREAFFMSAYGRHAIQFDCMEIAQGEFQRISNLLERKTRKANDLPVMLEVVGSGNRTSFPLEDLHSVSLASYEECNRQRSGIKEAFPNLF